MERSCQAQPRADGGARGVMDGLASTTRPVRTVRWIYTNAAVLLGSSNGRSRTNDAWVMDSTLIVLGGGPARVLTAVLLARRGYEVTLLAADRQRPRTDGLSQCVVDVLTAQGLDPCPRLP